MKRVEIEIVWHYLCGHNHLVVGRYRLPVKPLPKAVAGVHDPTVWVGQVGLTVPRPTPLRRPHPRRAALPSRRGLPGRPPLILDPLRLRSLGVQALLSRLQFRQPLASVPQLRRCPRVGPVPVRSILGRILPGSLGQDLRHLLSSSPIAFTSRSRS